MKDVAIVVGRTDDNQGYQILRRRAEDSPVEIGTVRPMREGKPIDGELVSMRPRKDFPFVYDVKTELDDVHRSGEGRPAKVASNEYRRGWDAIWGRKRRAALGPGDKLN